VNLAVEGNFQNVTQELNENIFSWHLDFGFSYAFSDNFNLEFGYRYVYVNNINLSHYKISGNIVRNTILATSIPIDELTYWEGPLGIVTVTGAESIEIDPMHQFIFGLKYIF
jgi:hypothetical protein